MLRKLVLSGLITLLAPGTVIQSVATVCFSLVFIVLHAVMCEYPNMPFETQSTPISYACRPWLKFTACFAGPYPYVGANVLKLYTDFQIFLVTLVGLVMRMDPATLAQEQFGQDFYGNALLSVLVGTLVLVCYTVFFQTPTERAVATLKKRAKENFLQVALIEDADAKLVHTKTSSSSLEVCAQLGEIFARVDRDSSGQLNRAELILRLRKDEELRQLLHMPAKVGDTDREEFEKIFQGMDTDDDRSVSREEFEQYFTAYIAKLDPQDSRSTPDAQGSTSSQLMLENGSDLTQDEVDVVIVDDTSTSQSRRTEDAQNLAVASEGADRRASAAELQPGATLLQAEPEQLKMPQLHSRAQKEGLAGDAIEVRFVLSYLSRSACMPGCCLK